MLKEYKVTIPKDHLFRIGKHVEEMIPDGTTPLRFAVIASEGDELQCTVSCLEGVPFEGDSIFSFQPRGREKEAKFNVAFIVPTGIGCEIGGHAGDATTAAKLAASVCDTLLLHPNVVNASDINEMPADSWYVEGSVLTRLLMGTIGLAPTKANRLLVILDKHEERFLEDTCNSVHAAVQLYGLDCEIVVLGHPLEMSAEYTKYGTAAGEVKGLEQVFSIISESKRDAVAISTVIGINREAHQEYFRSRGRMINPWGGVEAMLTHAISSQFNLPSAHAPMMESEEVANMDFGIVDPRMAAEAVSTTFFNCVLKGLHKSPKIIVDREEFGAPDVMTAADISCLVIPDGCLGLPTLAALEQGIKVIAVKGNKNLMQNDLTALDWDFGQLHLVETYLEAVGVLCALRSGIALESMRRPVWHPCMSRRSM